MIRPLRWLLSGLLVCTAFSDLHAHARAEGPASSPYFFIENKGQWPDAVRFAVELQGGMLFLENDRLTWNLWDAEDLHDRYFHPETRNGNDRLKCHAFRVNFSGASPAATTEGRLPREEYRNYYLGNDPSRWAPGVRLFAQVTYHDIYPGIDMEFYAGEEGIKYEFHLNPGAKLSDIRLVYEDAGKLSLEKGRLIARTTVRDISEDIPFSYSMQQGKKVMSDCRFVLNGNTVTFASTHPFPSAHTFVVDPVLVFATYSGSTSDNWGFTATYDDNGNLYGGGIVFGSGYPTTTGAYDVSYNGGSHDVSITKFNASGTTRLFSTYLGGNDDDNPHSLVVNASGELYVLGSTHSANFPGVGGFDISHNGNFDIFVARFNASGTALLNSTFMGGSGSDGINIATGLGSANSTNQNYGDSYRGEVNLDSAGNVYVASCTQSGNFPVTPGCPQGTIGGQQDGCVFKLSPGLNTLLWSTFIGGTREDAAFGITVDRYGNVFTTGGTESGNFPVTAGVLHNTFQGTLDGFVTKIDAGGTQFLRSTYIGTAQTDISYFVQTDRGGNVYILGQTAGNYPVTAGVYSNANSGQFITRLDPNLSTIQVSTRFGASTGQPEVSPTAFLVDICDYVYASCWGGWPNYGGSTNGMPTTPGAIQTTTDGRDMYFIVFRQNLTGLDYASYYGGNGLNEHVDGGTSRFDKDAVIYQAVCAGCGGSSNFPTTPGAVSNTNNSTNCNLGCLKISFPLPRVISAFTATPSPGCAPLTVNFTNQSAGATSYDWSFGTGATSTQANPTYTFTNPGTYSVRLISHSPSSCNLYDTAWFSVTVFPQPTANAGPDRLICPGQSTTLNGSGGGTYAWSPSTGLSNPASATPTASPSGNTTYILTVTNTQGCRSQDTVQVNVVPPFARAGNDTIICPGTAVNLSSGGGSAYSWTPAGSVTNPNNANTTAFPTGNTQYVVAITGPNNCIDRDTIQVTVSNITADAGPGISYCNGSSGTLNGSGGTGFSWSPPANLGTPNAASTSVNTTVSQWYHLIVTDAIGCRDTDSVFVTVNPLPLVNANPDTSVCLNDAATLYAGGAVSYAWTPGNLNGNPVSISPGVTTTYTVTGTDANNCQNTASVTVTVMPLPPALAGTDAAVCRDSTLQLHASGGVSYAWSPAPPLDNPASPDPYATLQATTDFIVTVTGANGCKATDTVNIRVIQPPDVNVSPDVEICKGEAVRLIVNGASTYLWSNGATSSTLNIRPDSSMTLWVMGFNEGCPGSPETVNIIVHDSFPDSRFSAIPDSGYIPLDVQFTNLSQSAARIEWYFGDGVGSDLFNPRHLYEDTGRFRVMQIVTNEFGCRDTSYKVIIVLGDFVLIVPNAFSPNGDDLNDGFRVHWIGIRKFNMLIYDRWGNLIYESDDPDFRWDGRFHGKDCQEGVYTWAVRGWSYLGHKIESAGTVTLIR